MYFKYDFYSVHIYFKYDIFKYDFYYNILSPLYKIVIKKIVTEIILGGGGGGGGRQDLSLGLNIFIYAQSGSSLHKL